MVDLPGLFRTSNREQSASDALMVRSMVEECMKRPRSIILAVVSAHYDFSLQEVTEMAQKLDPAILGVATLKDQIFGNLSSLTSDVRAGITEQRRYLCVFAERLPRPVLCRRGPGRGGGVYSRRLRAVIRNILDRFARDMHAKGEASVIVETAGDDNEGDQKNSENDNGDKPKIIAQEGQTPSSPVTSSSTACGRCSGGTAVASCRACSTQ